MGTSSLVILVTGASSGIGKATATFLAEKGFCVYGAGRSFTHLEKKDGYTQLQLDVTDVESVKKGVNAVIAAEGKIDVLINNAGLGIAGAIEETRDKDIDIVLNTNVKGVVNMVKAVAPIMRKQKSGYIINITSIGSKFSLPYRGIYCASKFAVEGISEALSMELKPFNVHVCTVAPGDVTTNINNNRIMVDPGQSVYKSYEQTVRQINTEVSHGIDPTCIGKKIMHIINTKRPLLHYRVATPMQRFSVVIKRILPGRWFEKLIMNHYKV